MYIPTGCSNLSSSKVDQQIRLGIQGFPSTGKTWAALTFKNPVVLNLDRGLGAHQDRSDVIEVPMYDSKFSGGKERVKDFLVKWIETEGMKLTDEQTLVIDGLSSIEVAYHSWFAVNQHSFITKQGKVDDFAEWQVKKKYFAEMGELVKSLKCDVILVCHEAERPDKPTTVGQPGTYSGKIRPLLSGAYGDILVRDYSDWFRQHASNKPTDYASVSPEALANWGMKDSKEFKAMCDTFPRNTIYYWQLEGDDKFDGKCSSLVNFPRYIPANFGAFAKYQKQKQKQKQT